MENLEDIKAPEANQSLERLEDVSSSNGISPEEYQKTSGVTALETLVAQYDHYKAELTVEYWWGNNGTILYGYTKQYRVTSNGNNRGNIIFGVHGHSGQSWQHELTGNAVQDGNWHDLSNGGWVGSPLKTGRLYFKYIFDRSGASDPAADTSLAVSF